MNQIEEAFETGGGPDEELKKLCDLVSVLDEIDVVLEVWRHEDVFSYVEICLDGYGIPPQVAQEIARVGLTITGCDTRTGDGVQTIVVVQEGRR